jgi:hypothetical protein
MYYNNNYRPATSISPAESYRVSAADNNFMGSLFYDRLKPTKTDQIYRMSELVRENNNRRIGFFVWLEVEYYRL